MTHSDATPEKSVSRTGPARAWIGPESLNSGHSHILGVLTACPLGVEVPGGAWFRFFEDGEWPSLDAEKRADAYLRWREEDEGSSLIPWHRIDQIDWLPNEEAIAEYICAGRERSYA